MKWIDCFDAIMMAMGDKKSITIQELAKWSEKYLEENPNHYVEKTRQDLYHEQTCKRIYIEDQEYGSDIIHLQETINCPICNEIHYKFPDIKKFELMLEKIKIWNSK